MNDGHVVKDIMAGSADVKALYPSFDSDFTIEVSEMFHAKKVQVDRHNVNKLGLYLALKRPDRSFKLLSCYRFSHSSDHQRPASYHHWLSSRQEQGLSD